VFFDSCPEEKHQSNIFKPNSSLSDCTIRMHARQLFVNEEQSINLNQPAFFIATTTHVHPMIRQPILFSSSDGMPVQHKRIVRISNELFELSRNTNQKYKDGQLYRMHRRVIRRRSNQTPYDIHQPTVQKIELKSPPAYRLFGKISLI